MDNKIKFLIFKRMIHWINMLQMVLLILIGMEGGSQQSKNIRMRKQKEQIGQTKKLKQRLYLQYLSIGNSLMNCLQVNYNKLSKLKKSIILLKKDHNPLFSKPLPLTFIPVKQNTISLAMTPNPSVLESLKKWIYMIV